MNSLLESPPVRTPPRSSATNKTPAQIRAEVELERRRRHATKIPYTPLGAAHELFQLTLPEVLLSGPAGTGKSRACLEKMHEAAKSIDGFRGLIVRKTRESLTEAALVTYEDHVLEPGDKIAEGPQRRNRQSYRYPKTGSRIVVGGMDKPRKIMSTEFDMIYVQEATELDNQDWQALTTRLRNNRMPYQQLIADCNPDAPTHWLYVRCQTGLTTMLNSRHEDNPRLWNGSEWTPEGIAYLARLDSLTGTDRDRYRFGLWVQASGLVYDVWRDGPADGNVTEEADYVPGGGSVLWFVDDGYSAGSAPHTHGIDPQTGYYVADSHPRVFLLAQIKADGHIDIFAEHYACLLQPEAHLAEVFALPYPTPDYAAVDKSAAALRGRLHAADIYTKNGPASVEESIKEMRRRLAPDANNWRCMRVHPRCKQLRMEMVSHRYDLSGRPVKQYDHGPDAARYGTHAVRNA